ncbi:MAG: hypothetical protein K2Y01_09225 [Rhabdochlamydiaceae bacterium]|nr:hypothetical protein [Rhabdochlamydiaceae bacterium]
MKHENHVKDAFLSQIPYGKFVRKILPESCYKEYISTHAAYLEEAMEKACDKYILQTTTKIENLFPPESGIVALFKKDEKEIRLLCFPNDLKNRQDTLLESNGLQEMLASEAVFSLDSKETSCYTSHVDCGTKDLYEQEAQGRVLLQERVPFLYKRLLPLSIYEHPDFTLSSKGPYYKTLGNELANNQFSLSASQIIAILRQVLSEIEILSIHGLVYAYINPTSIAIQRSNGQVTSRLNEFMYLTTKNGPCRASHRWMNALAYENFASLDTDLFGLIQLMAMLFSLVFRPSDTWDVEKQEKCALNRLEKELFPLHYGKILELKNQYGGFHKEFSKALLKYVDLLKIQEEEGFQICILEQFAEKMAVFPLVSSVLKMAIDVNAEQQERLQKGETPLSIHTTGPHMPSLQKIGQVLQEAEKILQELRLCRKSVPTQVLQVDKDLLRQFVTHLVKRPSLINTYTDQLHQVLCRYLQESPEVGSEKRFHKEPFSFRVCVGLKRVVIYSIGSLLGGGNYKTAKISLRAEISLERILLEKQMLSRSRKKHPEDIQMHYAILQLPEAEKYFVPLPRRHAGYVESNGKMRWEANRALYSNTLGEAIVKDGIYIDPLDEKTFYPLTIFDFISFLVNIAQGIDLIRQHGISHGDIKPENVGIFVGPEKLCKALLTDFDTSLYFPSEPTISSKTYRYWDCSRRMRGEIGERTDLYGLVLLIAQVFLYGFREVFAFEEDEAIEQMVQRICENPKEIKKEFLKKRKEVLRKLSCRFNKTVSRKTCGSICRKIVSWQNTEKHQKSLALKTWLSKALCFDLVYSLVEQVLKADQNDSAVAYPKMEDILRVLEACKLEAIWVDEECQKS